MRKIKPKSFKKRKRSQRKSQPKNVYRMWDLATRLEHRRIKNKK